MTHTMKLNPTPFAQIKSGAKTIELRLYDEKRRQIAVGDTIRFTSTADPSQTITARVEALYPFPSFGELYRSLPLLRCGYTAETVGRASPADMERYYSKAEERRCGVVGIELSLL
ncbi:MAG: DUF3850 domain-containing protein [Clostridiales bacterium]|nr:DUF3850 domain-containing protein [Clostridiales bacterium]